MSISQEAAESVYHFGSCFGYNNWVEMLFAYDFYNKSRQLDVLFYILKKWLENPPSKEVLKETKIFINQCFSKETNLTILLKGIVEKKHIRIYIDFGKDYIIEYSDFLMLLLKFGLELKNCDQKYLLNKIQSDIDRKIKVKSIFEKFFAGKKIAKYIEKAMDDEFVLTELRKRIDLRKFNDLMKEKNEF